MADVADRLIRSARRLAQETGKLKFSPPVEYVYNPLEYAWTPHERYLRAFGNNQKRVVFFGMNPGPFGMVQTGVPFGEITAVRDWMKISCSVEGPAVQCPKRPILGFDCKRSEVSGFRLWGLFAQHYPHANDFFEEHFVANYCPLAFMERGGRNITPDKLPIDIRKKLLAACNQHLLEVVDVLQPEWLIGIGGFAAQRAAEVFGNKLKLGQIPHPSPASPSANKNWAGNAEECLVKLGVWKPS